MEKKIELFLKKKKLTDEEISYLIEVSDNRYLLGDFSVSETIIRKLLCEDCRNSILSRCDRLCLSLLLAKVYLNNRKPLSAEVILDKIYSESLEVFGPRHCFSLSVLHHLAKSKSLLGKHKEASSLFLKEVFSLSPLDRDGELYEGAYEAYCREKAEYLKEEANPSR